MKLKTFIEKFVCRNTTIRLWHRTEKGYQLIQENNDDNGVNMEWQVLNNKVWHSKFLKCRVIGVKDIWVIDSSPESVNIVIDISKIEKGGKKNEQISERRKQRHQIPPENLVDGEERTVQEIQKEDAEA